MICPRIRECSESKPVCSLGAGKKRKSAVVVCPKIPASLDSLIEGSTFEEMPLCEAVLPWIFCYVVP